MPRYTVRVRYEQEKEIRVWARDAAEAADKACEIVEGWNGVLCADAHETDAEEVED